MPDSRAISVHVHRLFHASAERVFDAWLDPKMIGRWMFGPALRDEEIVHLQNDARPGGKFSFLVNRQGQAIDHVGEYLVIERPRRLVFTWGVDDSASSRVTIDISPRSETTCELVLNHEIDPEWSAYVPRTRTGWTKMIGVLDTVLSVPALPSPPSARAAMLIRKPVREVYQAFIDPAITTKFWFTRSSGPLEEGKTVTWTWEMYGASSEVKVLTLDPEKWIAVQWSGFSAPTLVEWRFTPHGEHATFVNILNQGFGGEPDKVLQEAMDSTEGFTWVLAGAKAWLEQGMILNAIRDRHPKEVK